MNERLPGQMTAAGDITSPAVAQKRGLDVSVIICAYTEKRWDDLVEAVQSIMDQTVAAREIIVVSDHNSVLFERVQAEISGVAAIPRIIAVENQEAQGLSGARNTGIAMSQGAVIAFMDEDAIADPHWLETLHAPYSDSTVIGVGGAIDPLWMAGRPGWFPPEFHWVVGCTYLGMPTATAPVRNLIGANMSFRREVFDCSGGFTNGMGRIGVRPVGCEETELCIRAARNLAEGCFLYEPRARVRHRVPAARANWRYFFARCYAEGLSKAQVARMVGPQRGLASERSYTLRTLPKGMLAGIADALIRSNINGFVRSVAILTGLLVTTSGYLKGSLDQKRFQAHNNRHRE